MGCLTFVYPLTNKSYGSVSHVEKKKMGEEKKNQLVQLTEAQGVLQDP